ncbi:MAG TPA: hypothetical protein VMY40_05240, partial [Anaerolineae bacterium]|nr:hypothetical protein [Anaerolineae bacterium]
AEMVLLNNMFVCCGTALSIATLGSFTISVLSSLISYCTLGATAGSNYEIALWDNNNWYGNGIDTINLTDGANGTATDPAFRGLTTLDAIYVDAVSNVIIKRAAGGFSTYYQAGDYIWLDAAASWTSGAYRIVTVDSDTQMTLATSPAATDVTGGIARTIRTAVGVSDCRPGESSDVLTQGLGLSLGVGA